MARLGLVASGSVGRPRDGYVLVLATGNAVGRPLTGNTGIVYSVAVSPDGSRIVSGDFDGIVR